MNDQGVSIITCTNKPQFIKNILNNYVKQNWVLKELILILNNNSISIKKCHRMSATIENVKIYKLPEKISLGNCLNYAIKKATHSIIAKFDDDDYYSPNYVGESINALERSKADIVGKGTFFSFLEGKQLLIVRFPNRQNRLVKRVAGGTIVVKKSVFNHVKFPNRSLGEDVGFLKNCISKGFRIYSTSKYNYVYMRRTNLKNHTLKVSDRYLLSQNCKIVGRIPQFKPYISQPAQNIVNNENLNTPNHSIGNCLVGPMDT